MTWQNDSDNQKPKAPMELHTKTSTDPAVANPEISKAITGEDFDTDKRAAHVIAKNTNSDPVIACISPGTGILYRTLPISDASWTQITAVLANRKALAVQNNTGFDIRVRHDDAGAGTAAAANTGMIVTDGSERNYDIQSQSLWVRAVAGAGAVTLDIEELS